jgi:hypothetical protein
MQYVITNQAEGGFILLGPVPWNARYFSAVISDELDEEITIGKSQEDQVPINIQNGDVFIRRCYTHHNEITNPKIQQHGSPVWEYFETPEIIDGVPYHAKATYPVVEKNIDMIKYELKKLTADERWKKESQGIVLTIQGNEVWCDTSRGNRDIFMQKFLLMGENDIVRWKFPSMWLDLTKTDLGIIVSQGAAYIQQQFDWESQIISQVDAATTAQELADIVIIEPEEPNGD